MTALLLRLRRLFRPEAPMGCSEVARVLQGYLDESLPRPHAQLVARHLEQCRKCGMEAGTYRALKESLRRQSEVPADAVQRLREFAARIGDDVVLDDGV